MHLVRVEKLCYAYDIIAAKSLILNLACMEVSLDIGLCRTFFLYKQCIYFPDRPCNRSPPTPLSLFGDANIYYMYYLFLQVCVSQLHSFIYFMIDLNRMGTVHESNVLSIDYHATTPEMQFPCKQVIILWKLWNVLNITHWMPLSWIPNIISLPLLQYKDISQIPRIQRRVRREIFWKNHAHSQEISSTNSIIKSAYP